MENLNEVWAEEIPSAPPLPESLSLPVEMGNQSSQMEMGVKKPSFCSADSISESVSSSLPTEGEKHGNANDVQSEMQCVSPLTSGKEGKPLSILSRRSKSKSVSSLLIQTGRDHLRSCTGVNQESNVALKVCNREETFCRVLFENEPEEICVSAVENTTPLSSMGEKHPVNCLEEGGDEVHVSDKENLTPVVSTRHRLRERLEELQISAFSNEEVFFYSDKENWTPVVPHEKKTKTLTHRDWLKINGEDEKAAFPSDEENLKKPLPWDFWQVDGEEEFSDKENITPNVSGVKKSKKKKKKLTEEITERRKERIPFQPLWENSPKDGSPLNQSRRAVDKERSPFRSLFDKSPLKKCSSPLSDAQRAESKEKIPFQSQLKNSPIQYFLDSTPLRNGSPVGNAQKRGDTGNKCTSFVQAQRTEDELRNSSVRTKLYFKFCFYWHHHFYLQHQNFDLQPCMQGQTAEQVLGNYKAAEGSKKKWHMVVDTDCFLNGESRKALQLLEGLRGTQLIIPRIGNF